MTWAELENRAVMLPLEAIEGYGVTFFVSPAPDEQHYVAWKTYIDGDWYGDYTTVQSSGDEALQDVLQVLREQAVESIKAVKAKKGV